MTFATEAARLGKSPHLIVEIDLDISVGFYPRPH